MNFFKEQYIFVDKESSKDVEFLINKLYIYAFL
jgi:hypothetical protein